MSLLEVEGVRFAHGSRQILHEVSLAACAGECIALLGQNGAGKSTLLNLITHIQEPSSGVIRIDGRPVSQWPAQELARRVSHLPQSVEPDITFTVGQLVAMGRYPHTDRWFESEEDAQAVGNAMSRTGCDGWQERPIASLSGGERQRVLLAACLAQAAPVLLLDEPSTYLDIEHQLNCFSLLRGEAQTGKLVIAVTHDLNLALRFCTRLVILAEGRIAQDLSVGEAARNDRWLRHFSPRLQLGQTSAGSPWVWYQ